MKNSKCSNILVCGKAFSKERLKNHKCDQCDRAFSQQYNLKSHINSVHKKLKNHKCELCDKAFSQSGTLKTHITSVHKKIKNHKCDLCLSLIHI